MTDEILNCLFTFFWKCCLEGKGKITTHPLRHPFKTYSYHYQSVITSWNFIPSPFFGGGGGGWGCTFLNPNPWNFSFFSITSEIPGKNKAPPPLDISQNWKDSLEISKPETNTPGNSTCYFFDIPKNSISSTPLFGFFLE